MGLWFGGPFVVGFGVQLWPRWPDSGAVLSRSDGAAHSFVHGDALLGAHVTTVSHAKTYGQASADQPHNHASPEAHPAPDVDTVSP